MQLGEPFVLRQPQLLWHVLLHAQLQQTPVSRILLPALRLPRPQRRQRLMLPRPLLRQPLQQAMPLLLQHARRR